jgi:hypothetical protein
VKIGDLVKVGIPALEKPFVSIILAICLPEEHRNGMHWVQVLEKGGLKWYPIDYIEVINASR